jgi:hypothetical protein
MVRSFFDGVRKGMRKERALKRYREMTKNPMSFTWKQRAEVYRELAILTGNPVYEAWAAKAEQFAALYD